MTEPLKEPFRLRGFCFFFLLRSLWGRCCLRWDGLLRLHFRRHLRRLDWQARELEQRLRGPIPRPRGEFQNPRVASLTIQESGRDLREELFDDLTILQDAVGLAAGMDAALLAEADQTIRHPLRGLRLGERRADPAVAQQGGRHVGQQSLAGCGRPREMSVTLGVTHRSEISRLPI